MGLDQLMDVALAWKVAAFAIVVLGIGWWICTHEARYDAPAEMF